MLKWTGTGEGARLKTLIYHDDAQREYAYGARGTSSARSTGTVILLPAWSQTRSRQAASWCGPRPSLRL